VPAGLDAAEAATLILSWTTAYQLLHRAARMQRGQRVLMQGAAGAVDQALLVLGRLAGFDLCGTARGEHAALIRELWAVPIDYQREDFTRVLPSGFDVVFDGIAEDGYRRLFAALKRGGLLCAYGYSAGVQAQRRMLAMLMWIARLYLWRWSGGKRAGFYSINVMRARHPAWFREDMERLFGLLATGAIRPHVAERISFDEIAEAHRRLEAGGLWASSYCARTSRHDATGWRLSASRAPLRSTPRPRPEWPASVSSLPCRRPTRRLVRRSRLEPTAAFLIMDRFLSLMAASPTPKSSAARRRDGRFRLRPAKGRDFLCERNRRPPP
jgi:hypothetical protein